MKLLDQTSAVILASGEGSRLGEVTQSMPKPLLEFGGKPYLQYLLNWLLRNGINDIVVTTYTHANQIAAFINDCPEYINRVSTVRETSLIGTVEDSKAGLECVDKATSFILTADNIWDVSLSDMYTTHTENGADATVLLTDRLGVPNLGKVQVDENNCVVQMWPSPDLRPYTVTKGLRAASTMGVYLVQTEAMLNAIRLGDSSIEREPMDRLIPNVYAHWNDGFFFDFGIPDNYRWLQEHPEVITYYLR